MRRNDCSIPAADVLPVEGLRGGREHRDGPHPRGEGALQALEVRDQRRVTDTGTRFQKSAHRSGIGELGHGLGVDEARHLDDREPALGQAPDELHLGRRVEEPRLVLQAVAWADFDELDGRRVVRCAHGIAMGPGRIASGSWTTGCELDCRCAGPSARHARRVAHGSRGSTERYPRATGCFFAPRSRGPGRAAGRRHRHRCRDRHPSGPSLLFRTAGPSPCRHKRRSLPPNPRIVSLSPRPWITSRRAVPRRTSFPSVPIRVAGWPWQNTTPGGDGGGGGTPAEPLAKIRTRHPSHRPPPTPRVTRCSDGCRRGPRQRPQSPRCHRVPCR